MFTSMMSAQPVLGGEFLEIDRRADAKREGDEKACHQRVERPHERTAQTGEFGEARVRRGDQRGVERAADPAIGHEPVERRDLCVVQPAVRFRRLAVDEALVQLVVGVRHRHAQGDRGTDEARVRHDPITHREGRPVRQDASQVPRCAGLFPAEDPHHRVLDDAAPVRPRKVRLVHGFLR
jgi:hypothetical protein